MTFVESVIHQNATIRQKYEDETSYQRRMKKQHEGIFNKIETLKLINTALYVIYNILVIPLIYTLVFMQADMNAPLRVAIKIMFVVYPYVILSLERTLYVFGKMIFAIITGTPFSEDRTPLTLFGDYPKSISTMQNKTSSDNSIQTPETPQLTPVRLSSANTRLLTQNTNGVPPATIRDKLTEIFDNIDRNSDGGLSRRGLKDGLDQLGMNITSQEVDLLFNQYDNDGSRSMSFEEFLQLIDYNPNGSKIKAEDLELRGSNKKLQSVVKKVRRKVNDLIGS